MLVDILLLYLRCRWEIFSAYDRMAAGTPKTAVTRSEAWGTGAVPIGANGHSAVCYSGCSRFRCPARYPRHPTSTSATSESFVSTSEDFRPLPATIAYNDAIAEAADLYELDPNLIRAIIRAESAFNPFAVSPTGAQGLMQLMPAVAEELNVLDPFDPRQNIFGGARYLRLLLDRNDGNLDRAVASYNAGPSAVDRFNGIPPYRETRNYVKKVNLFLKNAKSSSGD